MPSPRKVLLDGRVFSTGAHDRGMGRYVAHILELLRGEGHDITLLLFRDCFLDAESPLLAGVSVRFADYAPEEQDVKPVTRLAEMRSFTAYLNEIITSGGYDVYIDGTPFLRPARYDVLLCAVVTLCYDFIPMRHSEDYLAHAGVASYYFNGLVRVAKADAVISISDTVAHEIAHYLGLPEARVSVVSPRLEDRYVQDAGPEETPRRAVDPYLFCIMGSHRSKNPRGAAKIFEQVLATGDLDVRINVPTLNQYETLQQVGVPAGVKTTYDISEAEKVALQSDAAVVAHLSIEEGFGIPLLEALFTGKKVLALDIPMNREIIDRAQVSPRGAVLLLSSTDSRLDVDDLRVLLNEDADPEYYAQVRAWYLTHWRTSASVVSEALETAISNSRRWFEDVAFRIITSLPGTSCGVADYSVAYVRSTGRNVVIVSSEGDEKYVEYLPNVRTTSDLDFERLSLAHPGVPTLYNLAFSPALFAGVRLLQSHGTSRDTLLIHEREYASAFIEQMSEADLFQGFLARQADGDEPEATRRALTLAFSAPLNKRKGEAPRSSFPSDWLARLPLRLVHHLPPPVLERMQAIQAREPSAPVNELQEIEDRLEFAPLGIDDRATPAVARAAQAVRRRCGVQPDDLLVGHFGLVVDGIKRLPELARGVVQAAARLRHTGGGGRRIHFLLVGRVIHQTVETEIRTVFREAGLEGRLIQTNPFLEEDFEAELAACDLVACFRTQRRGQLSHVLVRAHALGRPLIVNRESGYGYDPVTLVDDEDIEGGVGRVIQAALDPLALARMRRRSRDRWEAEHRGDRSLQAILEPARA